MKGQKFGGRTKGTPNKATAEVKAVAQQYTTSAIHTLVAILTNGKSEQARIMAAREILDRGHGKAPQALTLPDGAAFAVPAAVAFLITKASDADCRD